MTHTNLYTNEAYLIVTSLISIGVLSGYEYFELVLAFLIIMPVVKLPTIRVLDDPNFNLNNTDKCKHC
jgi:hypothetical protein